MRREKQAGSCGVYSEEGGHAAWTDKKGDAAAVIVRRTFLQDPVLLHLDFAWTFKTCVPFLSFTMIQRNRAHTSLDYPMEADDHVLQILKQRAAA